MAKKYPTKGNYYLEYKKSSGYRMVIDPRTGYPKTFDSIQSARKYAVSMYRNEYYELIAVQGGGKFMGIARDGKPMYMGQTAGIVEIDWSRRGSGTVFVYRNYLTNNTTLLNKDGSLGKKLR